MHITASASLFLMAVIILCVSLKLKIPVGTV